jgi:hypothetical protein
MEDMSKSLTIKPCEASTGALAPTPTLASAPNPARYQLDRRGFLVSTAAGAIAAGAASTTAIAALSPAAAPDPVFAAIELHRRAYALYRAAGDEQERTWPEEVEALRGTPQHEPARLDSEALVDEAYRIEADALEDLCQTVPTSLAGIEAMMEYLRCINHADGREVFNIVDVYGFLAVIQSSVGSTASAVPLATGAVTFPSASEAAPPFDWIHAAIDRHKVAFRVSQIANRIASDTTDAEWHPDYDAVECAKVQRAAARANKASNAAANALTTIRPTTAAGVLALASYVESFNSGAFFLEPNSPEITGDDWRSAPMHWPDTKDADEIDVFGFAILANVRRALEAMAVQS